MKSSRLFSLFCLLLPCMAGTIGPVATLTIANHAISPDGFTRRASLVNGVHPGPVVVAQKGDRFKLNVVNNLSDENMVRGASLHWHGILQRGTNFYDGVVGVTQCPISPGHSFLYDFAAEEAGTFWYHSHYAMQYCDGVRGALIVYDPCDPHEALYDVDDESTIITLSEWYHSFAASSGKVPRAHSTLINGKGRYLGGPLAELAVVNVRCGLRYRLRLLSMSCDPDFTFSIDGHSLTVIEADSTPVQPYIVDTIRIFAGQRYSVVLDANQSVANYWIRALPNNGQGDLPKGFTNGTNSAILRYEGAPVTEPTSKQRETPIVFNEVYLHPLTNSSPPGKPWLGGADVTFDFSFGFDLKPFLYNIDNASYAAPTVPVILQMLSRARSANELLPSSSVYTIERGQVVDIIMPGGLIGGPHPFHLHGHIFSVIKSTDSSYFNFINPVYRDVVNVGDNLGDFVVIRFKADNPGPWIFHCHIDHHLATGLALVFAEASEEVPLASHPPAAWDDLCPIWDAQPEEIKSVVRLPITATFTSDISKSSARFTVKPPF